MAQKIEILLVDDLDGSPADETVQFSLDGTDYEIDLSADHARELRGHLKEYMRRGRTESHPTQARHDAAKIRAWASHNGLDVAPRGRIHRDILDAYHRAHP